MDQSQKDLVRKLIKDGYSHRQIKKKTGFALASISKVRNEKEELTENIIKNGIIIENPVSETVEELLDRFKIDKTYWNVAKSTVNEWGSKKNYNRQCKAWLERKGDIIDWDNFKKEFIETVKKQSPIVSRKEYKIGKCLMEVDIFDLHLDKLAWWAETGENYDSKIARKRFFDAINYFIFVTKPFEIDEILFPYGNDFFNSDKDYPFPQTTKGTPQENDIRWQKSYKMGRQMITTAVNMLSEIAPVKMIGIPGNHDEQKTFYLGDALECTFENNKNVDVDNSPRTRKYFQYGKNLLGFTHGKDIPVSRLLSLMPNETAQFWGKTKYREWHLGHLHHDKKQTSIGTEDHNGIVIRNLKSLKAVDSYEFRKGFGGLGGAEVFIWHKERGLVGNLPYNL